MENPMDLMAKYNQQSREAGLQENSEIDAKSDCCRTCCNCAICVNNGCVCMNWCANGACC